MTAQPQPNPPSNARVAVLAALAALACAWAVVSSSHDATAHRALPQPPPLAVRPGACPRTGLAAERAQQAEAAALARIARYPFAASEGLAALRAFEEAAACFEQTGDTQTRARVLARARDWKAQLERDYRGARVRLDRALREKHGERARLEARTLLALLAGVEAPYTRWLRTIVETQPTSKGEKR